jgi:hypothetical protein
MRRVFLLGQLQTEFREPLPHSLLEMVRILSELETLCILLG